MIMKSTNDNLQTNRHSIKADVMGVRWLSAVVSFILLKTKKGKDYFNSFNVLTFLPFFCNSKITPSLPFATTKFHPKLRKLLPIKAVAPILELSNFIFFLLPKSNEPSTLQHPCPQPTTEESFILNEGGTKYLYANIPPIATAVADKPITSPLFILNYLTVKLNKYTNNLLTF